MRSPVAESVAAAAEAAAIADSPIGKLNDASKNAARSLCHQPRCRCCRCRHLLLAPFFRCCFCRFCFAVFAFSSFQFQLLVDAPSIPCLSFLVFLLLLLLPRLRPSLVCLLDSNGGGGDHFGAFSLSPLHTVTG